MELAQAGDSARVMEERSLAQLLQPLGLAVQDIPVSRPLHVRSPGCSCMQMYSQDKTLVERAEEELAWLGSGVAHAQSRAHDAEASHRLGRRRQQGC